MDLKEIQNLIKFVARSGAAEVNLETEEFKIMIKTPEGVVGEGGSQTPQIISMPQQPQSGGGQATPSAPATSGGEASSAQADAVREATDDDSKYVTIKSPMIGTFYRRPSPDKELFVNVGDDIAKGDVVCIIEAMKLFNEIESEVTGKVVKILMDDQTPVQYDQPLFLVEPA